ncbi:MAG: hypothetical protein GY816_12405 [Cytophagales bacterium]|nr:hypothetical protein [Cytophagales bacterium]
MWSFERKICSWQSEEENNNNIVWLYFFRRDGNRRVGWNFVADGGRLEKRAVGQVAAGESGERDGRRTRMEGERMRIFFALFLSSGYVASAPNQRSLSWLNIMRLEFFFLTRKE